MVNLFKCRLIEDIYGNVVKKNDPKLGTASKTAKKTQEYCKQDGFIITSNVPFKCTYPPSNTRRQFENRHPVNSTWIPTASRQQFKTSNIKKSDKSKKTLDAKHKTNLQLKSSNSIGKKLVQNKCNTSSNVLKSQQRKTHSLMSNAGKHVSAKKSCLACAAQKMSHKAANEENRSVSSDFEFVCQFGEDIKKSIETAITKGINDEFAKFHEKIANLEQMFQMTKISIESLSNELDRQLAHYGEDPLTHHKFYELKSGFDQMLRQKNSIYPSSLTGNIDEIKTGQITKIDKSTATDADLEVQQNSTSTSSACVSFASSDEITNILMDAITAFYKQMETKQPKEKLENNK